MKTIQQSIAAARSRLDVSRASERELPLFVAALSLCEVVASAADSIVEAINDQTQTIAHHGTELRQVIK